MAKVEVQIRSCFCCGLSVATILIALYTLVSRLLLVDLDCFAKVLPVALFVNPLLAGSLSCSK